jgi:acetoin utilization deacetylase AcuC-like enzyme
MKSSGYSRRDVLAGAVLSAASFGFGVALGGRLLPWAAKDSPEAWEGDFRFREGATSAIAFHPFLNSHNRPGHAENPIRTDAALQGIRDFQNSTPESVLSSIPRPRLIEKDPLELLRIVHDEKYIEKMREKLPKADFLNSSRWAPYGGEFAFPAAVLAATLTSELGKKIFAGEVQNGFSVIRPPGHHAGSDFGGGYCLFNNVAVAAKTVSNLANTANNASAVTEGSRVAIVDLDVHHGNGTEEIFYKDPSVLYVSIHQDEWPYTGAIDRTGEGEGRGTNINVPLPPGSGDRAWMTAVEKVVIPSIQRFAPAMIFVSMGFDTYWRDPQGSMNVTSVGQAQMLSRLYALAAEICGGKICVVLEGGYMPDALRAGSKNVMKVLSGQLEGFVEPFAVPQFDSEDAAKVEQILQKVLRLHGLKTNS